VSADTATTVTTRFTVPTDSASTTAASAAGRVSTATSQTTVTGRSSLDPRITVDTAIRVGPDDTGSARRSTIASVEASTLFTGRRAAITPHTTIATVAPAVTESTVTWSPTTGSIVPGVAIVAVRASDPVTPGQHGPRRDQIVRYHNFPAVVEVNGDRTIDSLTSVDFVTRYRQTIYDQRIGTVAVDDGGPSDNRRYVPGGVAIESSVVVSAKNADVCFQLDLFQINTLGDVDFTSVDRREVDCLLNGFTRFVDRSRVVIIAGPAHKKIRCVVPGWYFFRIHNLIFCRTGAY